MDGHWNMPLKKEHTFLRSCFDLLKFFRIHYAISLIYDLQTKTILIMNIRKVFTPAIVLASLINLHGQTPGFGLIKKTVIGGEGGWDYLLADADGRRLYVSHSGQVEVLNLDTHEKIGKIAGQGIHGIAVAPKTGRGVITNGKSNTATIFDLKSLASIKELPTGKNPDALLYDNFSDRVFVFNHTGGSVTVINIREATVAGTVELHGEGVEAGVSDEKGTIFVNLEDNHEIVSFDARTLVVKSRWKISPGE
jgi:DNA-binding beta-propeller fold protein YncE